MALDSPGWHTEPSPKMPDGIRLVYLPPYSPQHGRTALCLSNVKILA